VAGRRSSNGRQGAGKRVRPPGTQHPPRAILAIHEVEHLNHRVRRSSRLAELLLQLSKLAPATSFSTGLGLQLRGQPAPARHTRLRMRKGLRCDPACLRQPSDPPWSPSGRLWGSGVPSTRSQIWALGRAFEHACRPVSGRASRLKNASLAEASLGLSRLQKERPHGWRGGPRQSRDERRFVYVLPHRCSGWDKGK
jgi:hypothetical protein